MLFWIFVIIAIVGIVWGILCDWDFSTPSFMLGIGCVVGGIMLLVIIINIGCAKTELNNKHEIGTALEYKINSGMYKDSFDMLDKDVVNEIRDWNKDLYFCKTYQDNFWIGIFIPNNFDEFHYIDYNLVK